jgi:hypothetical protein
VGGIAWIAMVMLAFDMSTRQYFARLNTSMPDRLQDQDQVWFRKAASRSEQSRPNTDPHRDRGLSSKGDRLLLFPLSEKTARTLERLQIGASLVTNSLRSTQQNGSLSPTDWVIDVAKLDVAEFGECASRNFGSGQVQIRWLEPHCLGRMVAARSHAGTH